MRLLLDTNILVSGLLSSKGPPGRLVRAWLDNHFELVTAEEQIDELRGRAEITSHFRIPSWGHLRPLLNRENPRILPSMLRFSLNRIDRI